MVNRKISRKELEKIKENLQICDWDDPTEQMYREKINSPITAIRAFCVGCMGGQVYEVRKCTKRNCQLYPFRMGKNPFHGNKDIDNG